MKDQGGQPLQKNLVTDSKGQSKKNLLLLTRPASPLVVKKLLIRRKGQLCMKGGRIKGDVKRRQNSLTAAPNDQALGGQHVRDYQTTAEGD